MSGVIKGVKKVFKKVAKVAIDIAPIALAVGAVVFTAGAALAPAGTALAAGWGGAVSSGLGALGISGTGALGGALTGAITQAGYGAAIGAVGSLVMGGDIKEGAQMGALAGAVTGGVTGAIGGMGAPAAAAQPVSQGGAMSVDGITTAAIPGSVAPAAPVAPAAAPAVPATGATGFGAPAAQAGTTFAPSAAAAAPGTGAQSTFGKILESPIAGNVIKGFGTALMGDGSDAQIKADREDREARAATYRMAPGSSGLLPGAKPTGLRSPSDLYMTGTRTAAAQRSAQGSQQQGRKPSYRFDAVTGTITVE